MAKSPKPAPTSSDAAAAGGARPAPQNPDLPLFYRSVRPVDSVRDAATSIKTANDFSFARRTNAVPLNAIEYVHALRHFPIVFSASSPVMTLAIVGIRDDANLFVDAAGQWRKGTYIPAYARRYPFIFISGNDPDKLTLGVDETAPHFRGEGAGVPLFVDGEPSAQAKHALAFCEQFQAHLSLTQEFCRAIAEQDLLVDQGAQFEFKSGDRASIQGFRIIDEAKFQALPDDVILEWRKKGYLPLVFAHFFSMRSWADLLDAAAATPA